MAGTDDEAELRFVARLRYSQLRQQANESTASFRLRFDARIHAMNTVGQDPPNQEDQAREQKIIIKLISDPLVSEKHP